MKSKNINTLKVQFSLPLRPQQIPQWRGAVAESAGWKNDLFHNHNNNGKVYLNKEKALVQSPALVMLVPNGYQTIPEPVHAQAISSRVSPSSGLLYRYPLIHYRVIKGRAAIFGLSEGAEAIRHWLLKHSGTLQMGGRDYDLYIDGMKEQPHELRMLPYMQGYRLMDYVPLNQENYRIWQKAQNYHARIDLLERMLTGHIISFANAAAWRIPERFKVEIMLVNDTRSIKLHGVSRLAFNLIYKTNIDLAPGIALGRGISHGFGTQMPTRKRWE